MPGYETTPRDLAIAPAQSFGAAPSFGTPATTTAAAAQGQALYLTEPGDQGPISVTDISQGQIGDCFLLASVGEEAFWRPQSIAGMIHDTGGGTQAVQLYAQTGKDGSGAMTFRAAPQTVSDTGFASNGVNSGGQATVNGVQEIWPQVIEEAYAQGNGGYSGISSGGYATIAEEQLTGLQATGYDPASVTAGMLTQDQAAGDLIVLGTASSSQLPFGLYGQHAYMYEGETTVNGTTYVRAGNPWGIDQPALIPASQLAQAFNQVDVSGAGAPNLAAPVAPPNPQVPATAAIVIDVSESAWQGDAQFVVLVDGTQVGGVRTATAAHSGVTIGGNGPMGSQAINLGQWSNDFHQVSVTFLNDAYGGSASTDRNLFVDGIQFGAGQVYPGTAEIDGFGAGTAQTSTFNAFGQRAPAATPGLVLEVTEDAWQGDAHFTVAIDGVQTGGIRTETLHHGPQPGGAQGEIVLGALTTGQHTVSVTFLNDAYGGSASTDRNLYVEGASFNGTTVGGSAHALYSNGTFTFGLNATPPVGAAAGVVAGTVTGTAVGAAAGLDDSLALITAAHVGAGAAMQFASSGSGTVTEAGVKGLSARGGVGWAGQAGDARDTLPGGHWPGGHWQEAAALPATGWGRETMTHAGTGPAWLTHDAAMPLIASH